MIYLDTSLIVKCYVAEPGSARVLSWLEGRRGLACCQHGRVEFFAAVMRHVRERRLKIAQATRIFAQLAADENDGLWQWLPITESLIQRTCDGLAQVSPKTPLRAADALHLACAAEHGGDTVYTHDAHMLVAARLFGLAGVDLLADPPR